MPHHDCNLPLLDSYLVFVSQLLLCNETQPRNITQLSCKRFMYAAAPCTAEMRKPHAQMKHKSKFNAHPHDLPS